MTSSWEAYRSTMVVEETLWSAAKDDNIQRLARLLDEGADINAQDHRGYSALMLSAYAGNVAAFEFLLGRGADANSADHAGNTVLMGAAFKGHMTMVETLIAAGADWAAKNFAGMDALQFATTFGRADIAALLTRRSETDLNVIPSPSSSLTNSF